MRRRVIMLFYGCLAMSVACQRETAVQTPAAPPKTATATATTTAATTATTTGAPQDMKDANINQLLPAATAPVEKSLLGTSLGTDGNVTALQTSFRPTDPIHLTMWLKESPKGLQTSARWFDAKKKEIAKGAKSMDGAKVVTFTLDKKLAPGKYHVTGMWGGNEACDFDFEVVKK